MSATSNSMSNCRNWSIAVATFAATLMFSVSSASAANIAPSGTGFIGTTTNTALNGTENDHAGSPSSINDNNTSTHIDDYPYTTNDYVGITFSHPVSNIQSVGLVMAMFVDGGWYGPSNTTPGAGNPLTPADLTAPTVQVTSDGVNWTNVATTDNYVSVMTGAGIGGGSNPNPNNSPLSTFTLDLQADNIVGIRLLGNGGGVAGDGGFIGVSELFVNQNVPEPSAIVALLGVCGMGLIGLLVRRRRNHAAVTAA